MFTERSAPISELVKGDPDKPLREPVLILLACIFTLYHIYGSFQKLLQLPPVDPYGWMQFWYQLQMGLLIGMIWFNIAFIIVIIVGALIIYFINRRAGGALVLVVSIIGVLVSFMSFSILIGEILGIIVNFLGVILALMAGVSGIRGEKTPSPQTYDEFI